MTHTYAIGDTILQHCFGEPRTARWVKVTGKVRNIKNGRDGFDGTMLNGVSVWGYDEDVVEVIKSLGVGAVVISDTRVRRQSAP